MRTTAIVFALGMCTLSCLAQNASKTQSNFIQDFEHHWTKGKRLAVEVAEAMPAEDYSFRATPQEMTFGEQMTHMTGANYGYCAFIADAKPPYEEPKGAKKETIVKDLADSFDYCEKIFDGITDAKLDSFHGEDEHRLNTREIMLGVMVHMAHHRGQAEVYLRLKGIKPPKYVW
jgi:uncharacterized damage-inducible protein DinB